MHVEALVAIVMGVINFLLFAGGVTYAILKVGKNVQGGEDKTALLESKYVECCADVAAIRLEMKINAKAVETSLGNLHEKVNSMALDHEGRISWCESRLNGKDKR